MNHNKYNIGATRLALALFVAGFSLAACNSDENLSTDENVVKFNVTTRAENGDAESPWVNGDQIVIYRAPGNDNEWTAKSGTQSSLSWDGSKWTLSTPLYWTKYNTTYNFMAYFPNTASNDGEFSIPADQSTAEKLHKADYMTTQALYKVSNTGTKGPVVDLAFSHRLAKVIMKIVVGTAMSVDDYSFSDVRIISGGSKVNLKFNSDYNRTQVNSSGDAQWISPFVSSSDDGRVTTCTAIVAPSALSSGNTPLMTLLFNGVNSNLLYTGTLTALESGKAYIFSLKLGIDKLEVGSVTVRDWDAVDGGDASYDDQKD